LESPKNLKESTINGFFWVFLEKVGLYLSEFITSVVLARILEPEEFGIVALVSIFIAISNIVIDGGLGNALLRKKEATIEDYSTVFYTNIVVSITMYGLLYFVAPLIAEFYNKKVLTDIVRVIAIVLPLSALNRVQSIIFTKKLDFKTPTIINFVITLVSSVFAIFLALNGFSYWSLVYKQILGAILACIFYWGIRTWFPRFLFSIKSFKEFFGFGSKLLLSGLLNTLFENIYPVIIGKFFSITQLAFYNRGKNLKNIPILTYTNIISKVTFPVFVKLQDDIELMQKAYKKLMKISVFIIFTSMFLISSLATPIVIVIYTEKWAPVIPYLKVICLAGLFYPLHVLNLNVIIVKGRSDLFLYLEIVKKIGIVLTVYFTMDFGVMGLLWGQFTFSIIGLYVNAYFSKDFLNYSLISQTKDIMPYLILGLIQGLIFMYVVEYFAIYTWWSLLIFVFLYFIVAICISYAFKLEAFYYLLDVIKSKLPNKYKFISK
jgi:O-antigen/teichoic acid export membrane protein